MSGSVKLTDEAVRTRVRELEDLLTELRGLLVRQGEALPTDAFSALEVRVADSWYLLPLAPIREVVAVPWVQKVPNAPSFIVGTFRLGADVVPLCDVRERLEGERTPMHPSLLVVVADAPRRAGFLVAEVGAVVTVEPREVVPPPASANLQSFLLGSVAGADATSRHVLSAAALSQGLTAEPAATGDHG